MKIRKDDLEVLKKYVDKVLELYPNVVETYETGNFPRSEKVKNLQERFCFDLLYASKIKLGDGVGVQGDINIYSYMNDTHLYTALKSICPKVTRRY